EYGRAVRLLGDALAVWRGPVLADVPSQRLLREEAPRLDTMRLDTIGLQVRAQLVLGEHAGLVPRLRSLTAEYPRREQFWGLLMAALALTERQADALTVFAQASAALELGEEAEPGAQLWHIRQLIADGGDDLRLIPLSHLEDPACSMV
ncbi:MAG: AfsR/SARP family transcriptional regulator, partial [Actinocrinis sp.]